MDFLTQLRVCMCNLHLYGKTGKLPQQGAVSTQNIGLVNISIERYW